MTRKKRRLIFRRNRFSVKYTKALHGTKSDGRVTRNEFINIVPVR